VIGTKDCAISVILIHADAK